MTSRDGSPAPPGGSSRPARNSGATGSPPTWPPDLTTRLEAGDITLWDVATGGLTVTLRDVVRDGPVTFLPDRRTLAVGSSDWLVVLWQLDPAAVVRRWRAVVTPQARVTGQTTPSLCH
jgi:WD40 repeat protein